MLDRIHAALRAPDAARRLRDFVLATLIYAIPAQLRRQIFAGNQHICPVCKAELRTFLRLNRPFFAWCPVCRSLQRHRLVWLLLERMLPEMTSHSQPKILHFAPEPGLTERFQQLAAQGYVSLDRYDRQAMLLADICALPVADTSMDLVYCSHVLEHIVQDSLAMRELVRVLKAAGIALILVPLRGEHSYEDASISGPAERERAFGQHDHVRWYGMDIVQRLEAAGFAVEVVRTEDIASADEIGRYGLDAGETVFVGRKAANF